MSDPKYIDAEKLKRHYAWWDDEAKKIFDEIIDLQPAADVVEVCRCKDCKHSEHWYGDKRRCFLWHENGIDVFETGYCNYGERKDG